MVIKRGRRSDFIFYLFIFIISFVVIFISVFYFSELNSKSMYADKGGNGFYGKEGSEALEDTLVQSEEDLNKRPGSDDVVYLHAPSTGIVPRFGLGFTDLPIGALDLYPNPTISSVVANGNWESSSSWDLGRVPQAGDVVFIRPGHTIILGSTTPDIASVNINGTLSFSRTVNTRLNVGYIYVRLGGKLDMGNVTNPILDPITTEIHFLNVLIPGDTNEVGPGLTALGTVTAHGQPRQDTFVRTTTAPAQGATTITLEKDVQTGGANGIGWKVGDEVVVPASRWSLTINDGHETEERTISAISGNTITLNSALAYPHPDGCTYDNPATCNFKPHVALLSRNVKITSDPAGNRATISILDTASQLDMRYVEVNGLGRPFNRGARPGRYAIHLHHLHFMGQNTAIVGSSISNALSVGIRIHGTDFSLIKDNVILNTFGYGISAEDATENGNVIDHNIVLNIPGDGSRPTDLLGIKENGISIFLMNPLNIVKNNVGAGYAARSFIAMVMLYGSQRATIWNRDGTTKQVYIQNETIVNMDNNENYGPTLFGDTEGLDVWHPFTHHSNISIIKNYRAWNTVAARIFYPAYNIVINNFTARNCHDAGYGNDDYDEANIVFRNSDIRGCGQGILAVINSPDTNFYTNVFLANMSTGISLSVKRYNSIFSTNLMPERDLIFRNMTFSGNTQDVWGGPTGGDNRDYIHYDRIFFFDYNGVKGDNFEYFFPYLSGNNPYPASIPQCTTTRGKIVGFTCPVNLTCGDNDGDGYGVGCYRGLDCNDNDSNVNPGMPEVCGGNTIDDNCDGVSGVDGDGDGYGTSCSLGTDCQDGNAAINSGALETVGVNNNCDGRVKTTPAQCGGADDPRRVLFLSFDDTLNDGSGNGNQGSCYSSCPSYVTGVSGSAIRFTQNYPYEAITVARNPSLDLQEFSLELWAYPRSNGNIFTRTGTWPPYNIAFSISIDNGRIKIIDNNRNYVGGLISFNRWHHIAATRTAQGKVNLYLDGELTLSFIDKMPLMIANDISIGSNRILPAEPYLGSPFQGDIDNLALYNKVLSFGEVLSHNNSGVCSVPTCTDNDGDGYGRGCSLGEDCNDVSGAGAAINPGASEVCGDNIDNNCNLQTDECCDGQKAGACWNEMPARSMVLLNTPIVVFNNPNLYFLNQFSDQNGDGSADYPPVIRPVWKQIDLEGFVPKEATGVLLRAVKYNNNDDEWAGLSPRVALRALGSYPRNVVDLFYIGHNMSSVDYTTYIPFSAGKKGFEYEGEHFWRDFPISLKFEVVGYTLANSTTKSYTQVFNPPVRAFQATGLGDTMEWVEVDLSSYLPADAKAVIMQVQSWGNDTRMGMVEIRSKNIPTSNMSLGFHAVPKSPARFFLLGAEKKVEYRIMGSDTNSGLLNFDLLGYFTDSTASGLTTNFFNDPVEVYENYEFANNPWKNINISSWVPSSTQAAYVAVEYKTGGGGSISSIKLSAPSQTANAKIELWDHRDVEEIYLVPVENGMFSFTTINSKNTPVPASHMRLSLKGYLTGAVVSPTCTDGDLDGYNVTIGGSCGIAADCNDNNATIYPGAVEICGNGIDEDCSGSDLACAAVCGNGICEAGENCPADVVSCNDNTCYEPTCTNGCGQVVVANGGNDEACILPNTCNGAGSCIAPLPCVFTNANWSTINAIQGQSVNVNVYGNNCNGQLVNFSVLEADALDPDDPANINPISVAFSGGSAIGTWTAEWQCDGNVGGVCTFGNPEYFFIAGLVSNASNSISSEARVNGLLTTTASSSTCGNNITEGAEQCDDGNTINGDGCSSVCGIEPNVNSTQPTQLKVFQRNGQTFITWKEKGDYFVENMNFSQYFNIVSANPQIRYNIYRYTFPISSVNINQAELIAFDISVGRGYNAYIYGKEGVDSGGTRSAWDIPRFVINESLGGWNSGEIPLNTGLFVYTTSLGDSGNYYYAITLVNNSIENRADFNAENSLQIPILESYDSNWKPILQNKSNYSQTFYKNLPQVVAYTYSGEQQFFTRWEATPLTNAISHPQNYWLVIPSSGSAPYKLDMDLHCWGGSVLGCHRMVYYTDGIYLTSTDYPPQSWWTGWNENFSAFGSSPPQSQWTGVNKFYTMHRMLAFIDWMKTQWNIDSNRVMCSGWSMGGSGGKMFCLRYGEYFNYINSWAGIGIASNSPTFTSSFTSLFGDINRRIPSENGINTWDDLNMSYWLRANPLKEVSFISFSNGKNDANIGWAQAVEFYEALRDTKRAFTFRWSQEGHENHALDMSLDELNDYAGSRRLDFQKNKALPAFNSFSLDNSPGNGDPANGELAGYINAYQRWDPNTIVDQLNHFEIELWMTSAPNLTGTTDVTLRNLQALSSSPSKSFNWSLFEGVSVIRQGIVLADQLGLITISSVPIVNNTKRKLIVDAVVITPCVDSDSDGWNATSGGSCGVAADCNDNNAAVNPGAVEMCADTIDNNCNGLTDSQEFICQSAVISISSPASGSVVRSRTVIVNYIESGNLAGVNHTHLQLDAQPEIRDLDNDGVYSFTNVADGAHTVRAYMADVNHVQIGNSVDVSFSVNVPAVCGNNIIESGEVCDDSNTINGDGCSSICQIESGWSCSGEPSSCLRCTLTDAQWSGVSTTQGQSVQLTVTGNNCNGMVLDFSVFEDDTIDADDPANINPTSVTFVGNNVAGYWISEWQCDGDLGGVCTFGNPEYYFNAILREDNSISITSLGRANGVLVTQASSPTCGNNITEAGEQCDDGNIINTDSCLNSCVNAVCGDTYTRTGVEQCDSNSQTCTVGGYSGTQTCNAQCNGFNSCVTTERCGDGVIQAAAGETCDDGALNGQPNKCNNICIGTTASICGNTVAEAGEQCDDGNAINTDACNACIFTTCGDSIIQNPNGNNVNETCDDGALNGQPNMCNSACTGTTSALCGNNITEGAEQCDDGNAVNTDSCTNICRIAACGDNIVWSGVEQCDAGLSGNSQCTLSCTLTFCGDGIIQSPNGNNVNEICDSNSQACSDNGYSGIASCSGTCLNYGTCVPTERCGDNVIQPLAGETCDDGNTANGDGCNSLCRIEIIGSKPALLVIEPQSKEYKNVPVTLDYSAAGADNCWIVLNSVETNKLCVVNEILNISRPALNVKDQHSITVFANNTYGNENTTIQFNVTRTRKYGMKYNKFSGIGETTNLDSFEDSELENLSLTLDNGLNGKIKFIDLINITSDANETTNETDIDNNVYISDKRIEVNSTNLKSLNKKAQLTFRNINFNAPKMKKDGVDCSSSDCSIESYTANTLVVNVTGFSVYTVEEGQVQTPPPPGGDTGGDSGSSSGSSSGSDVPIKSKPKEDNRSVNISVQNPEGEELSKVELLSENEEAQSVNVTNGTRIVLEVEGSNIGHAVDFVIEDGKLKIRIVGEAETYDLENDNVIPLRFGDKEVYFGVSKLGASTALVTLGLDEEQVKSEMNADKARSIIYVLIGIVVLLIIFVTGLIYKYIKGSEQSF